MGKSKNKAIEQVMDELNEEVPSSLNTSLSLLSPDLLSEPAKTGPKEDSVVRETGRFPVESALIEEALSPAHDEPATSEEEPSSSPDEPATPEELSELENLLSFEPNKNKYAEPLKSKPSPSLPEKEDEKEVKPVTPLTNPSQKKIVPKAIGKMMGLYNQTAETGVSIGLKQFENLRVAQERIVALEEEIDRLRKENEELISAGDIFRERLDKMTVQNNNLKTTYEESREEFQEEKKTLMNTVQDQVREMDKMVLKNRELEKRLSNNIQQIRVRERELENRLELMKLDSQTLVREKDQYILDLKRQIDRIKMDLETQKNRHTEAEQKLKGQKSQTRRATRGLQMALHILRGNDFSLNEGETDKEE